MERNHQKLFREITEIMRHDYAGISLCTDTYTPRYYNQAIGQAWNDGVLNDRLFLNLVNQMFACTGDRHLKLEMLPGEDYEPYTVGFTVRRIGEVLYVTDSSDQRLPLGSILTEINGGTPSYHRQHIQKNFFYSDKPEREDWNMLLLLADTVTTDTGKIISLKHYPLEKKLSLPSLVFDGTDTIIFPGNFDEKTKNFLNDHRAELKQSHRIFWDLRHCSSNSEEAFPDCFQWMIQKESPLSEILPDNHILVNYSLRNRCVLQSLYTDVEDTLEYMKELSSKTGYISENITADPYPVSPVGNAENIVFTDIDTSGTAETFALAAKKAGIKLVGRATAGNLDLSLDLCQMLDDRFFITWPAAIREEATAENKWLGKGLEPELYIPFTPSELNFDNNIKKIYETKLLEKEREKET